MAPVLNPARRGDSLPFAERYRAYMQVFDEGERAALLVGGVPAAFDDCIARGFADAQTADPLRHLLDVDFATQLPDDLLLLTDKMSMAVSLECRVPLLDQRLVAAGAAEQHDARAHRVVAEHRLEPLPRLLRRRALRCPL